ISLVYISDEIPVLSQDGGDNKIDMMNSESLIGYVNGTRNFGIVLVHGFGGGVFSWRHVMGVLARQFGCLVAAFDRPGWGLTSRPQRKDWEDSQMPNPYKLETQVVHTKSFLIDQLVHFKAMEMNLAFLDVIL
ncbi:hypothetical protein IFM89_039105, partial [Coptis chinensis]